MSCQCRHPSPPEAGEGGKPLAWLTRQKAAFSVSCFDPRPGSEARSKEGLGLLQPHALSKNANAFSLSVSASPREEWGAACAVSIVQVWRLSAGEDAQRLEFGDVKASVVSLNLWGLQCRGRKPGFRGSSREIWGQWGDGPRRQQFNSWQCPWVRKETGGYSQLQGGPINVFEQYNA